MHHDVRLEVAGGLIPEDQYGGGSVIVWDAGSYGNLTKREGEESPVADAIEGGHVAVWPEGRKLRRSYALSRFRNDEGCWSRWTTTRRTPGTGRRARSASPW